LVKEFAINGIIMTIITVISNIVLLYFFDFKIIGYLISLILAEVVALGYKYYAFNGIQRIKELKWDSGLLQSMLKFSVPIVPTSAIWWIINGSTRYFVLFFVGTSGNGLYAVANKIPSIIAMLTSIFSQAWQLSSFEEYESESKNA